MTKTVLSGCMAILFAFSSFSQATFQISEPYERVNTRLRDYFEIDGNIYSIKFRREGAYVQSYGSEAQGEVDKELLPLPEGYNFEAIIEINSDPYVFYSVFDKKAKTETLIYRKLDFRKTSWDGDEQVLLTLNGEAIGFRETSDLTEHKTKFKPIPSENGHYFLVTYTLKLDRNDENDTQGFLVLDQNLIISSHHQKKQEDFGDEWKPENLCVANNGSVICLMTKPDRSNEPKIKWVAGDPLPQLYQILILGPKTDEVEIISPQFDYPVLSNLTVFESPAHGPCIMGFYHPRTDQPLDGFFIQTLNGTRPTEYKASYRELARQEVKYYRNEDRKKMIFKPEDMEYMALEEIHHMEDSTQLIIMERKYSVVKSSSPANTSTARYRDELLIIKADYAGNIQWMRYLPKRQVGSRIPGSMSYSYTYDKQKHYFMYMEHVDNATSWDKRTLRHYGEGATGNLVAFTIDDTSGELTKEIVFDSDNVDKKRLYHVWPVKILHISDNEFAVDGYQKKKGDVMVKITLGS